VKVLTTFGWVDADHPPTSYVFRDPQPLVFFDRGRLITLETNVDRAVAALSGKLAWPPTAVDPRLEKIVRVRYPFREMARAFSKSFAPAAERMRARFSQAAGADDSFISPLEALRQRWLEDHPEETP
jgi:hypothetical protein